MEYDVEIAPSGLLDIEAASDWMKQNAPAKADAWLSGLLDAILSLETFPRRCPIAPESEDIGREIRQLFYGKRSQMYRILFAIVKDKETSQEIVRVHRLRHTAQAPLRAREIQDNED